MHGYVPTRVLLWKQGAGSVWPEGHNLPTSVSDNILLLKTRIGVFQWLHPTSASLVILAIELCLKQYDMNVNAFLGAKKDKYIRTECSQPHSWYMQHHEACWNTAEWTLIVSACTDTETTSYHKAIKALPWLSLAWRQADVPHGASVPQIHWRLGDPKWWTLPSSVLHTILRASVHLSNLLCTFRIIILLSNIQSHIHPFLYLYIIFLFIHKIFTELRYSHVAIN